MRWLTFGILVLSLLACRPQGALPDVSLPSVQPIPYRIVLDFSSNIPDDYPVLSGPIETYRRIQVNEWFQSLLYEYIALKETPEAEEMANLRVELIDLQTGFERLGAVFIGGAAGFGIGDEPGHIPQVIIKSVRMKTRVSLRMQEELLLQQEIDLEGEERIERPWFDSWTYDYAPLIRDLLEEAILEIDRLIEEAEMEGKGVEKLGTGSFGTSPQQGSARGLVRLQNH